MIGKIEKFYRYYDQEAEFSLKISGLLILLLSLLLLIVLPYWPHTVIGSNSLLKPIRSGFSIGICLLSFSLILPLLKLNLWQKKSFIIVSILTLYIDMAILLAQGVRGVRSHFNFTPVNIIFHHTLGIVTSVFLLFVGMLLIVAKSKRNWNTKYGLQEGQRLALQLGMAVFIIGSFFGGIIVANGGHTVGSFDGYKRGLPFLEWLLYFGDYRIPHFIGIHALQMIPIPLLLWPRLGRTGAILGSLSYFFIFLVSILVASRGLSPFRFLVQ